MAPFVWMLSGKPCSTVVPISLIRDQGSQFTSHAFTSQLEHSGILISMDGRGRVFDNIFVERLWRTVKYEDIYIKGYETVSALMAGLEQYFKLYNHERPHQHLQYRVPAEVHFGN